MTVIQLDTNKALNIEPLYEGSEYAVTPFIKYGKIQATWNLTHKPSGYCLMENYTDPEYLLGIMNALELHPGLFIYLYSHWQCQDKALVFYLTDRISGKMYYE